MWELSHVYIRSQKCHSFVLTHSTLGKISADDIRNIFVWFSPENSLWHFMQIISLELLTLTFVHGTTCFCTKIYENRYHRMVKSSIYVVASPWQQILSFKGSIFLKNRHFFFIQERFNKLWHLKACKISVSLSFFNWIKNKMIFNRISEVMLPALIQRYAKNHFIFKNERLTEILQAFRCHMLWLY